MIEPTSAKKSCDCWRAAGSTCVRNFVFAMLAGCAPTVAPTHPPTAGPSAPAPPAPVTFGATSIRIEAQAIELTHLDARWDRNGQLALDLIGNANHPHLILWFHTSAVPGGPGRFEATPNGGSLDSRACTVTGTVSAPTIPKQLTAGGAAFAVDLDLSLADCSLTTLVLKGHVQVELKRALPPEL